MSKVEEVLLLAAKIQSLRLELEGCKLQFCQLLDADPLAAVPHPPETITVKVPLKTVTAKAPPKKTGTAKARTAVSGSSTLSLRERVRVLQGVVWAQEGRPFTVMDVHRIYFPSWKNHDVHNALAALKKMGIVARHAERGTWQAVRPPDKETPSILRPTQSFGPGDTGAAGATGDLFATWSPAPQINTSGGES